MSTLLIALLILLIAILMAMVGKGGGMFYVIALVFVGVGMHQAASTSQAIMLGTSIAAMVIFSKHKVVDWKLALVIDPPTDIMAFIGGYFASYLDGQTLKIGFAVILIIVSLLMFLNVSDKKQVKKKRIGYWHRQFGTYNYTVNLWITIPLTALVGLMSGAVGISGGAFKIPLMVMLCGVPMSVAIGTSSAMVAVTALMGLLGHSTGGNFDIMFALPPVLAAIAGGLIGGKLSLKNKPAHLKQLFAVTNIVAAVIILVDLLT
jgi:hypothetical protein